MSGTAPSPGIRHDVCLTPKAAADYLDLDSSVRLEVTKALVKLERDPIGYGEPLGKKAGINLFHNYSIRAGKRVRVIYRIERLEDGKEIVLVLTIGKRERFAAHRTAEERIRALAELTKEEFDQLVKLTEIVKAPPGQGAS